MTIDFASGRRTARRFPTALALTLLCSLCLNVGFASYIAVQAFTAEPQSTERANPEATIASFATHLPSRDADILWQVYRAKAPQIQAADAEAQRARGRVLSILSEPDLDADRLRATFKETMEGRARTLGFLVEVAIEALQRISPDGRRQLIEQIHSR
jgi:uncharacterized membrane protein